MRDSFFMNFLFIVGLVIVAGIVTYIIWKTRKPLTSDPKEIFSIRWANLFLLGSMTSILVAYPLLKLLGYHDMSITSVWTFLIMLLVSIIIRNPHLSG